MESNKAEEILDESICGDLYWNIIFYCNFVNLPSFFIQKSIDLHVLNFSLKNLSYYQFDEKAVIGKAGSKTTINNSGDISMSQEASMNASPDKLKRNVATP